MIADLAAAGQAGATTAPLTEDDILRSGRAVLTDGVPHCSSRDHGAVFADTTTPSPVPTRLHLWLIALGIDLFFIRKSRPTDHSIIERAQQNMTRKAVDGQNWSDQQAPWNGLDERRVRLNFQLPTAALDHQAHLQAYPTASHSGRAYRPEWEAALLDLDRVYRSLAQGRWFRQVKPNGRIKIGGYHCYLGLRLGGSPVTITPDPDTGMLICQLDGKCVAVAVAVRGGSKPELAGELAGLIRLPAYQLALPLSPAACREQLYTTALTGTS